MQAEQPLRFGPYRLDPKTGQLWRGRQEVKVTPKAAAVLGQLVARGGQVVSKEELFGAVWLGTVVSDAALSSCIQELRRVLQDAAKKPAYIGTVHKRGFRFLAPVGASRVPRRASRVSSLPSPTPNTPHPTSPVVGREAELGQLHDWWAKALRGERQLIFVTGEPGIGKTTLVNAFLNQIATDGDVWIGRGQCIEHYGTGEAYLPLLEALGRLGRGPDGQRLITVLHRCAPTWLVQLPAVLGDTELAGLQRKTAGATRERMLRELTEAMEQVTAERPLVLWLEDLHWSDGSTLDWLAYVARRPEQARLLILGTYRPVDVLTREHPLKGVKQELQLHGQCEELALDFLSEAAVADYLAQRFGAPSPVAAGEGRDEGFSAATLQELAHVIHQRTDGNPLFMVNVVNALVARGVLVQSDGRWELQGRVEEVEGGVPESLRQMIEQQIERLRPETQRLLEVASVAGAEFSAAAVAAGLETEVGMVEEQCGALARREHFLRASGTVEWPDGTVAARYGFLHGLYQDVLYHRLTTRRRQRLHQRIGEREEAAYGERAGERAAELAVHFERGRDYRRTIQYLQQAGENAIRRSASQEAITLLTKGLELLKALPDTPERARQELVLQMALFPPLVMTKGYAAAEVEKAHVRALELCRQLGETPQLFWVLMRLSSLHSARGEPQRVYELGEQLLTLAQRMQDPAGLLVAHATLGTSLLLLGELASARAHLEKGIALYDPQKSYPISVTPGVVCFSYAAAVLWVLGYPDQALKRSHEALTLAQELSHPFSLAYALANAVALHRLRREGQLAQERAEALIALSREQGFPYWVADEAVSRGWALAEQGQGEEGVAQIRQGLAARRATQTELGRPQLLALLAEAYGKGGQAEEGLKVLAEALAVVEKTVERRYEAELYRLKGELTLQQSSVLRLASSVQTKQKAKGKGQKESSVLRLASSVQNPQSAFRDPQSEAEAEAEACFLKAIEIARKQQAKSLELRATMSLSRLWQQRRKTAEARQMLAEIYGWFTEGFDTADLKEAKVLLVVLLFSLRT